MNNSGLSYFDLAIVLILLFFIFKGFNRGFTQELLRILGTIVALVVSTKYMSDVSVFIANNSDVPPLAATIVSFIVIFVAVIYLFRFLSLHTKKAIDVSVALGGADKIAGGVVGLAKGAILVSLITILLSLFSFSDAMKKQIKQSALFNPMRQVAPLAYDAFKVFIPGAHPFADELEENFKGLSNEKKGAAANALIEYYKSK